MTFSSPVTTAVAVLTGFNVSFSPSDGDHHLGNLNIQLRLNKISPTVWEVIATFGLRDWSGTWDDRYHGIIFFAAIGE